ncbi:MAG TPA: redox-sensing transcriptional repressor Rex [Candidatus Cloacimonadota bacterium]|nr:redox-sensing transcriptional repressor Rex [Candidatus Cloacimonadota bacterium]
MSSVKISDTALRRLPKYIYYLQQLKKEGRKYTSASEIASVLNIHHTQVRKDFALTGLRGVPKVGHKVDDLLTALEGFLNWNNVSDVFLIGVGNIGKALVNYNGFQKVGMKIVAAFDVAEEVIGTEINSIRVYSMTKMPNLADRLHIHIAILCTPSANAQEVASYLCENGIRGIWNFTPEHLTVPDNVVVENVNIYPSLAVFSKKMANLKL